MGTSSGHPLRNPHAGKNRAVTIVALPDAGLGNRRKHAIFSVVQNVLLRPLPYPEPDQLVEFQHLPAPGPRGGFVAR